MALEKAVDKVITEQKRGADCQVSVPIRGQYQLPTYRPGVPIITNSIAALFYGVEGGCLKFS